MMVSVHILAKHGHALETAKLKKFHMQGKKID